MKNMRMKLLALTLAIAMTAGILPATSYQTVKAQSSTVKKVTVTNVPGKKLTLRKGQTFALKTKVIVTKGSKKLIYKSSNKKVAPVNKKGVIKAKNVGTARITVAAKADKKKKTEIRVTVTDKVKVQKIKLNATEVTLSIDMEDDDDWDYDDEWDYDDDWDDDDTEDYEDEFQLTAAVSPANAANKALAWSSSDEDVVEVSKDGFLIAIDVGEAVVKARAKDGSGVSASCRVTVIDDTDDDMDGDQDYDDNYDDDDGDDYYDDDDYDVDDDEDGDDYDDYDDFED